MRTRCKQCRDFYRWTLDGCPRCLRPNENAPLVLLCKVLAMLLLCVAAWGITRLVMSERGASGVALPPMQQEDTSKPRTPEPAQALSFTR